MSLAEIGRLSLDSSVSHYVKTGKLPIPEGKQKACYRKKPGRPRLPMESEE